MAYILYTDGTRELRSEAEAKKLWLVLAGHARPTTQEQKARVHFIRKAIKKVRLNYRTAPEEYIKENLDEIVGEATANWIVDRSGRPSRPANKADMDFAIKYGLWRHNKPTVLVTGHGQLMLV